MNPFLLSPQERLSDWKQFRKHLEELSEDEQLQKVAEYWAQAPLLSIAYDVEQPDTWLTPWEMIYQGDWCKYSVAIGMEFTLRLAGWDSKRLSLAMIRDNDLSDMFFVVIIDDLKVLNYTYSRVSDYPKTNHDVINRMTYDAKHYVFK